MDVYPSNWGGKAGVFFLSNIWENDVVVRSKSTAPY